METTTSFDLNKAIQHWRDNLAQSPAFRSENLYELETHLRDCITMLQCRDLSPEEAFAVATKRIGNAGELENEFGKLNHSAIWLDRALWILIGAQLWALAGNLARHSPVLLNVSLTKLNTLLATYGFGRIPESIPRYWVYALAFPLILIVGASLCVKAHRWAERRGWSPLNFVLNRPALLACVYVVLLALPGLISYGMERLEHLFAWHPHYGMPDVSGFQGIALGILPTVVFATMVLLIARRRLNLSRR